MDVQGAESVLRFAEQTALGIRGPEAKVLLAQLEERHDDLRSAMQLFVDERRPDEALRLANSLYAFWITKQRFEEGATWFDRVLQSRGGDDRQRGTAYINAGFMPFWMGQDDRASALFNRGLEMGRQLSNPAMVSQALGGLARVALRRDVAEGRRLAREASP